MSEKSPPKVRRAFVCTLFEKLGDEICQNPLEVESFER